MQNQDLWEKLTGTPKNYKFSETIFGHLDSLLKEKPNLSLIASETFIMFVHNKTIDWLSEKSDQEKDLSLRLARNGACGKPRNNSICILES